MQAALLLGGVWHEGWDHRLRARLPGFKSCLCHLLAMWPEPSNWTWFPTNEDRLSWGPCSTAVMKVTGECVHLAPVRPASASAQLYTPVPRTFLPWILRGKYHPHFLDKLPTNEVFFPLNYFSPSALKQLPQCSDLQEQWSAMGLIWVS